MHIEKFNKIMNGEIDISSLTLEEKLQLITLIEIEKETIEEMNSNNE